MLKQCRPYLLFILLLQYSESFSQQSNWPKSLLWRISGNGLTKPSYVYGTMHLQDKRVFHFTDSVYKAIEDTEGLALEVDFNELIDSMINLGMDKETAEEGNERVNIDKKKIDKSLDSIFRNLKIDADNVTAKNLKKIREYRVRKLAQQGEMPTIVDGYLFGLAVRQGKWTGGIEDVSDQLNLVDEIGDVLTPEKAFEPEAKLRASLETLIRVYADSDLESIHNYIENNYGTRSKNVLLINRNVKMARRMDSLMKFRSMFFAVGAAHLPGDSGVIRLLRANGYQVDPVFSPRTITPQSYSSKLASVPWKLVDEDAFYSVLMPGTPTVFDRFGESVTMKMFFDLPSMTYYLTGHTIRNHENYTELSQTFRDLVESMGGNGKKIKIKDVSANGLIAAEGSFDIPAGSYKVRLLQKKKIMFMLMTGSTKKANLNDADLNKFFTSFVAKEVPVIEQRFREFTIPGKDFTVNVPGTPKPNRDIDKSSDGSNWYFTTYDLADREKGVYYMVQVRDIRPGHFIEGDTSYFNIFSTEMAANFQMVRKEQFTFQGWPAMKLDFLDDEKIRFQMFTVLRGNRVYTLFGGGQKTHAPEIDTMFGSFRLTPPPPETWKTHYANGFSTIAPAPLVLQKNENDDEEEDDGSLHFVSYDPRKVISYEVMVTPLSKYYWAESDSAFYAERLKGYREHNDTLLSHQKVKVGKLDGIEFVLRNHGSTTVKKVRTFVNGDSIYTAIALLPEVYLDDENGKRFFTEFRIAQEKTPAIFVNKAKELFIALQTKDSVEFQKTAAVLEMVDFTKKDLPYLHEGFFRQYAFEASYQSVNAYIADALKEIADSSTVDYIGKNYKTLNEDQAELKYEALHVLAKITTRESYTTLKTLLLSHPPEGKGRMYLAYALQDSLELTKSLFPEILQLADNSGFSNVLAHITGYLADTGLITSADLVPYKENILAHAERKLVELKKDPEEWWDFSDWPRFIGILNDNESNRILQKYLKVEQPDIQFAASLSLVKNNQPVSKEVFDKLAGNNAFRIYLYRELRNLKRLDLFPAKYATQQKIAESEIYELAGEDDEYPGSVSYLGERYVDFRGKKQRFLLFKVGFGEGKDVSYYLGIAGPYSDSKDVITETSAGGIYWEEEYDKAAIDAHLREWLLLFEED